jgi:hypothetical protein
MSGTAVRRIRRLRDKRDRLREEIKKTGREIGRLRRHLAASGKIAGAVKRRPNARRLNDVTVSDAIVQLLRERRKAMHYRDITRILLDEGRYRTKSRSFLSTVAISIQRDPRVKRVEPGIYKLKRG